jgi:hypothetical protein
MTLKKTDHPKKCQREGRPGHAAGDALKPARQPWKFTSAHATAKIEFGTTNMDGKTVYFVRDDGADFDMAFSDKLFKPFKRLHAESEFPGIGIGLAIAHRIILRHNGRLWAESAPEKGATFFFTL